MFEILIRYKPELLTGGNVYQQFAPAVSRAPKSAELAKETQLAVHAAYAAIGLSLDDVSVDLKQRDQFAVGVDLTFEIIRMPRRCFEELGIYPLYRWLGTHIVPLFGDYVSWKVCYEDHGIRALGNGETILHQW
jgi:hypothetical protein